ncbi:MAG: signal peptide peptidase SppA [bacterium]
MTSTHRPSGLALALALIMLAATVRAAGVEPPIPSYYSQLQYSLTSPGTYATPIGGFANPGYYDMLPKTELRFSWTSETPETDWGAFLGGPYLGFGAVRTNVPTGLGTTAGVMDYRLALSGGNRNVGLGLAYGWSQGETGPVGRSQLIQLGYAQRIGRYVSVGLAGNFATEANYNTGLFDLSVRPTGTPLFTVFGDLEMAKGASLSDSPWSVGAMFDLGPGLEVIGRYFENDDFAVSVGYNFSGIGFWGSPRYDKDANRDHTVWQVRAGFPKANILDRAVTKDRSYLSMNLKGTVTYRDYKYFSHDRNPLIDIVQDIKDAQADPQIRGIAINLSGAVMTRGKAWEIREQLVEFRKSGKRVVIFADEMGMTEYHLASVADKLVMDPMGMIMLPGYVMGRTFLKEMLDKLGIGFEAWRYLKYKSAAEVFARTDMSEADREQRLAIIEDIYATVRADVTGSRNTGSDVFDDWVNEDVIFPAEKALDLGLVDALGRWEEVKDVVRKLEGENPRYIGRKDLAANRFPSELYGEDPKIAVVYGLGECAMDSGIKARQLEKIFRKLKNDPSVKAVVFRVDSPGGDALASDVVAGELRKCAKKKPVIISQGDVAGSGGYWISMYGTEIYALPTTITGSIGVIAGWVWDEGFGDKIGHTSDFVKVGDHADLGFGIRVLLAGPMLPKRDVTDEERQRAKTLILDMYDQFVAAVADGRKMNEEDVARIAQGHVYSGTRGKEIGLVDEIGGMEAAITAARKAAGIDADEEVEIVELPEMPPFQLPGSMPYNPFGSRLLKWFTGDGHDGQDNDSPMSPEWTYLRAVVNNPGRPLYMVPPELYDYDANLGW